MTRAISAMLVIAGMVACSGEVMKTTPTPTSSPTSTDPRRWSDAEWRAKLTPEEYNILRQQGTEMPNTGKLLHNTAAGTYACAGCGQVLFDSGTKYDACGWPSFWDARPGTVATRSDGGAVEAICSRCDSHLGHIFDDGPDPTGKRY